MMCKLVMMYWQIVDCVRISTFRARFLFWASRSIFHDLGAADSCEQRERAGVFRPLKRQQTDLIIVNWNRPRSTTARGVSRSFLLLTQRRAYVVADASAVVVHGEGVTAS